MNLYKACIRCICQVKRLIILRKNIISHKSFDKIELKRINNKIDY